MIAVCSDILKHHVNGLREKNVKFMSVKRGGTYINHWDLKGLKPHSRYGACECIYCLHLFVKCGCIFL